MIIKISVTNQNKVESWKYDWEKMTVVLENSADAMPVEWINPNHMYATITIDTFSQKHLYLYVDDEHEKKGFIMECLKITLYEYLAKLHREGEFNKFYNKLKGTEKS